MKHYCLLYGKKKQLFQNKNMQNFNMTAQAVETRLPQTKRPVLFEFLPSKLFSFEISR